MKLDKISENVYANTEGMTGGNTGVILLKDYVIAVDSKYPVTGAEFRRSIATITSRPVTHLLITHSHGDHIFGMQAFEDCEIVAQRLVKEKMEANLKTIWSPENLQKMIDETKKAMPPMGAAMEGLRIVLPTKTFDEEFELDGVKMIRMVGHTDDCAVVYVVKDKVLFMGDNLFAKAFPFASDPTTTPDGWIDTFKKILAMDVDIIVPGHGAVCDKTEVQTQLDCFETIRSEIKKLIANGASVEDVVNYKNYPALLDRTRPEWREAALRHFYDVWSAK